MPKRCYCLIDRSKGCPFLLVTYDALVYGVEDVREPKGGRGLVISEDERLAATRCKDCDYKAENNSSGGELE